MVVINEYGLRKLTVFPEEEDGTEFPTVITLRGGAQLLWELGPGGVGVWGMVSTFSAAWNNNNWSFCYKSIDQSLIPIITKLKMWES